MGFVREKIVQTSLNGVLHRYWTLAKKTNIFLFQQVSFVKLLQKYFLTDLKFTNQQVQQRIRF